MMIANCKPSKTIVSLPARKVSTACVVCYGRAARFGAILPIRRTPARIHR
jgi:hypothetical protein